MIREGTVLQELEWAPLWGLFLQAGQALCKSVLWRESDTHDSQLKEELSSFSLEKGRHQRDLHSSKEGSRKGKPGSPEKRRRA